MVLWECRAGFPPRHEYAIGSVSAAGSQRAGMRLGGRQRRGLHANERGPRRQPGSVRGAGYPGSVFCPKDGRTGLWLRLGAEGLFLSAFGPVERGRDLCLQVFGCVCGEGRAREGGGCVRGVL